MLGFEHLSAPGSQVAEITIVLVTRPKMSTSTRLTVSAIFYLLPEINNSSCAMCNKARQDIVLLWHWHTHTHRKHTVASASFLWQPIKYIQYFHLAHWTFLRGFKELQDSFQIWLECRGVTKCLKSLSKLLAQQSQTLVLSGWTHISQPSCSSGSHQHEGRWYKCFLTHG